MSIIDIIFIVDIVVCFRTTFMDDEGKEVKDGFVIAK